MPTRDEIYQAIRNADAAGDSESVQKLGAYLQTMDSTAKDAAPINGVITSGGHSYGRMMPKEQQPGPDLAHKTAKGFENFAGGTARGAGSIGATILTPYDYLAGNTESIGNPERRAAMDSALQGIGVDTNSAAFKTGKIATEIAGTAPIGGVIGKAVTPLSPALGSAISSGGLSLGGNATNSALANALLRVGGGAISGGATAGAINPEDTGYGTLIGGAIPAGVQLSGAIGNGIGKLASPVTSYIGGLTEKGATKQAVQKLQELAGGADNLANAGDYVPATAGIRPTLAEATLNPGIASTELATSSDPVFKTALRGQQDANKLTMINLLDQMRGGADGSAKLAAQIARKQAVSPLYDDIAKSTASVNTVRSANLIDRLIDANPANKALTGPLGQIRESLFREYPSTARAKDAWDAINETLSSKTLPKREWDALAKARTIMNRAKTGAIDSEEALAQLKGISGARDSTNELIDYAVRQMKTPDYVLHDSPQALKSAIDNINGMLANPENSTVKRALTLVKNSLGHQINKAEPAYGEANKTFAEFSKPINQYDVADELYNKFVPSLTESGLSSGAGTKIRANAYAEALRKAEDSVRSIIGRNMALDDVMTPEQMSVLKGIQSDLSRSAQADALAASKGSPTNQNEVINAITQFGASKIPGGNMLLKIGKAVAPQSKTNQMMAQMLLDPQSYAKGAELLNDPSMMARLLSNPNPDLLRLLNAAPATLVAQ